MFLISGWPLFPAQHLAAPEPLGGATRSWSRRSSESSLRIINTLLMSGPIYTALVSILFLLLVGIVNWEERGLLIEEENLDVIPKWGRSLTSDIYTLSGNLLLKC